MSERYVKLSSGAVMRVLEEWRCPKCGEWISADTMGHTSFANLAAGAGICTGLAGTGRKRTTYLVALPTEKQRAQIAKHYDGHPEFHPLLKWRRATAGERQETLAGAP